MTFDHQIDFATATRGSVATALKVERQVIARKLLVAQAFAGSAGSTTAMHLYGGDQVCNEAAARLRTARER